MLSFFAVSLALINVQSQSVCLWAKSGLNSMINGLYTAGATHNSKSYYSKSIPTICQSGPYNFPATLYLFYNSDNSEWRVGDTLDDNVAYIGYCSSNQDTPTVDCGKGKWLVADTGGFAAAKTVFAQADSCPSWSCASVTTTMTGPCAGPFITNEGSNAWSNSGQSTYLFYHAIYAAWFCSTTINTGCDATYSAISGSGWVPLLEGQNTKLDFDVAATPSPTTAEYTVECKDAGGGSTNPAPTFSPVVSGNNNPSPTVSPVASGADTPAPTISPITNNNNTPAPTKSPVTGNGNPPSGKSSTFKMVPMYTYTILITLIFVVI